MRAMFLSLASQRHSESGLWRKHAFFLLISVSEVIASDIRLHPVPAGHRSAS